MPELIPSVAAGLAAVLGAGADAVLGLALVLLLVPVTLIDLEHRIIPNRLTLSGAAVALVLLALTAPGDLVSHLVAGAAAGGFLLVSALLRPAGMGMGDVKLAAVLGLFLGRAVVPALVIALIAGSLTGLAIVVRRGVREGREATFPFGPFLALGGVVGVLGGDELVDAYLGGSA